MIEQLTEMLDAEPFVPFRLWFMSGIAYEVLSAYQLVLLAPNWAYVFATSKRSAWLRPN
jgi:hypothetical protein